jgi:hypothetical protein
MLAPPARAVTAVVAGVFVAAPTAFAVLLSSDERTGWPLALVAAGAMCGGALLFVGTINWTGRRAFTLRLVGFALVLAASLAMTKYAFLLVPLALVAAVSLRPQR